MKKLSIVIVSALCLVLTACGGEDEGTGSVVVKSEASTGLGDCGMGYSSVYTQDAYQPILDKYNAQNNTTYTYGGRESEPAPAAGLPDPVHKYYDINASSSRYEIDYSNNEETYYTNVSGGDDVVCEKYQPAPGEVDPYPSKY